MVTLLAQWQELTNNIALKIIYKFLGNHIGVHDKKVQIKCMRKNCSIVSFKYKIKENILRLICLKFKYREDRAG